MKHSHEAGLEQTCDVCGGCTICVPHAPGSWIVIGDGNATLMGGCRSALLVHQLELLDVMETLLGPTLQAATVSPRSRRIADDLLKQIGHDRDAILGIPATPASLDPPA